MRNTFRGTFIILMLIAQFSIAGVGGNEESAMAKRCSMYQVNQMVNLVFLPVTQKPVVVNIYDGTSQKLVMTEKIKSNSGFSRVYNLNDLKNGRYIFEVIENNESVRRDFIYVKNSINTAKVDLKRQDNYSKASLTVTDVAEPIKVNIFDLDHRLLFSETIQETGTFNKLYDLSALGDIDVLMEISEGNKVIKRSFL